MPQLQARLKEVNGYIDNLLNAIQQGLFNALAKKRLDELEESKQEIETAIYSEQLQKPEITKDHIVFFITKFRKMNLNDKTSRKQLIDSFVNGIYLYDDKIVFSFNYKDGTKELTLDEINEELSSDLECSRPPRRNATFCQPPANMQVAMTLRSVAPFPTNLLLRKIFAGTLNIFGVLCAYFTRTSPPTRIVKAAFAIFANAALQIKICYLSTSSNITSLP